MSDQGALTSGLPAPSSAFFSTTTSDPAGIFSTPEPSVFLSMTVPYLTAMHSLPENTVPLLTSRNTETQDNTSLNSTVVISTSTSVPIVTASLSITPSLNGPEWSAPPPDSSLSESTRTSSIASRGSTLALFSAAQTPSTISTFTFALGSSVGSSVGDGASSSSPLNTSTADPTGDSSSTASVPRARVYEIVGGMGTACAVLALTVLVLVWRRRRWSLGRRRRAVHDSLHVDTDPAEREADTASLPEYESTSEPTLVENTEKGAPEQENIHSHDEESVTERSPDSPARATSNSATLRSDMATAWTSELSSSSSSVHDTTSLSAMSLAQSVPGPPPSYRTQRTRFEDGIVRLSEGEVSLRRVGTSVTSSSGGTVSVGSLMIPPPPYQMSQ